LEVMTMARATHLSILLAAVAALLLPAGASAAPVPVAARLTSCLTGPHAADRSATFTASMPALRRTRHMWIRFELAQRRGATGAFVIVDVPGWGGWEKSAAGRPGFVFSKRVEGLLAPAAYRAQVTLRWLDAQGDEQREVVRTTPSCRQPDPRPDLRLSAFSGRRTDDPAVAVYTVTVRDRGATDVPAFVVALGDGTTTLGAVALGPLAAGARASGQIRAPACAPGTELSITLDAGGVVDERDETAGVVRRPCPLA
jgi:hypothetical protein